MTPNIHMGSFFDELEKISVAGLPAGLSMGGLGALTAIEGSGALDKKKSTGERIKDGLSAAATGSILAGEAIHNKDMLKGLGKKLLTKKASEKTAVSSDWVRKAVKSGIENSSFKRGKAFRDSVGSKAAKKSVEIQKLTPSKFDNAARVNRLRGEAFEEADSLISPLERALSKKAAIVSNAAMMKNHMLVDSQRAAAKPQAQAAPALMRKDPSHYSDFTPSASVGHQPVQKAAPAVRSSVALPSAGPVRSAARPQAMGVMARIANTFKKA